MIESDIVLGEITDGTNPFASTELASLANNALIPTSVINGNGQITNSSSGYGQFASGGSAGNGCPLFAVQGSFVFGGTPTNPSTIDIWFLAAMSAQLGFPSGSASITPPSTPDVQIPVGGVSSSAATPFVSKPIIIAAPFSSYGIKGLIRNNATGQTLTSGSIRVWAITDLLLGR